MLTRLTTKITEELKPFKVVYKERKNEHLKGVYFLKNRSHTKVECYLSVFLNNELIIDDVEVVKATNDLTRSIKVDRKINEPVVFIFRAKNLEKELDVSCIIETELIDE